MAKPTSLGDSKAQYKRVQENFDLPDSRAGIVSKFERILDSGGVQRIVVELGHPIKVDRLVKSNEGPDIEELPDDDWMDAVRNGEVQEFSPTGKNPYAYLFQAFHMLSQKRMRARIVLIHSIAELKAWLGLEAFIDVRELFGVEVRAHPEVPEQAGIIISTSPDAPDSEVFSMRLAFDKPKEKADEANRRKGS